MDEFLPIDDPRGLSGDSVSGYANAYPHVVDALKRMRPRETIAAIAGLLTLPELQANCFRLEVLAHLAAAFCCGQTTPAPTEVQYLFDALDSGVCGRVEDPAENVFVGLVHTSNGNFRVFEGLGKGATFYLQSILDVLETAPSQEPFGQIRRSVQNLLKLSEYVAESAGIAEHELGHEVPIAKLSDAIASTLPALSGRVRFENSYLKAFGIAPDDLSPFIFDTANSAELLRQDIGHSDLERCPLLLDDGCFYLALPTAIASAIARFVLESVAAARMLDGFAKAFAAQIVLLIRQAPGFSEVGGLTLARTEISESIVGHQLVEVDHGLFFQIIVVFEGLKDFDNEGFNGSHHFSVALNAGIAAMIADAHRLASQNVDHPDGLTLVVSAGIGRGFECEITGDLPQGWRIVALPIHDFLTVCRLEKFHPLTLWRIDDQVKMLGAMDVILINPSGLINLIGLARTLNGRIVSDDAIPYFPDAPNGIKLAPLPTNAHRAARREAQRLYGMRRGFDVAGRWRRIHPLGASPFDDEGIDSVYACVDSLEKGELLGASITKARTWWLSLECPEGSPRDMQFEYWRSLCLWLSRAAPEMDEGFQSLPSGPILLIFAFDEITNSGVGTPQALNEQETRALIEIGVTEEKATISIRIRSGFDDSFIQAENVGDRALVEAMIRGAAKLNKSGDETKEQELLNRICPRGGGRRIHRWSSSNFRDFLRFRLSEPPVFLDPIDQVNSLLGLGHKVPSLQIPSTVSGKQGARLILNEVVKALVGEMISELQRFDRREFLGSVIRNYEMAVCNREHWRQTSRALVATQKDAAAATQTIVERNASLNACTVASRILMEAGLCTCPLDVGGKPGELDLARLMAKAMIVHQFGGWSDAIHWDAMAPVIRVNALGEIQANIDFIDNVCQPFGRSGGQTVVEQAIESYDAFFADPNSSPPTPSELDTEFMAAWETEFEISIQAFRGFIARLEELSLESNREVVDLPRSQIVALLSEEGSISEGTALTVLDFLTSKPRPSWSEPPGGFALTDLYPWRFRRRLAILRRPFLQLDDAADPKILCAPGLISDAFRSMIAWYRRGEIQKPRSKKMAQWMGRRNNLQRSEFNKTVAERLRQLGWQVRAQVNVTEILGKSLDRDYGDIDVLAWRADSGRILAIECKDLQIQTTISEIAEQLSDFRGQTRPDAKRDLLKKHLDRIAVLRDHRDAVALFVKLESPPPVEGHLVFSRDVPMRYAWGHMTSQIKLSLLSTLDSI